MAFGLSDNVIKQLAADHRKLKGIHAGYVEAPTPTVVVRNKRQVQFLEDLDPATDFATGATTAQAQVLFRGSDGNLYPLKINDVYVELTVTNRFEGIEAIAAFTYGVVEFYDGEWHPDVADCAPAAGGSIVPEE